MAGNAGENAREQDVGRPHRRTRDAPSPETEAVLDRYRAAMRLELGELLDEIRPETGQLALDGSVTRPKLEDRRALWDLAIKLGKELAAAPEPLPPARQASTPRPRSSRAPRLSARDRAALGAT